MCRARPLVKAEPTAETLPPTDVLEDMELVLEMEGLQTLLEAGINARLEELISERRKLKQQMEAQGVQQLAWLQGIDDVSPASFDLLTVRLLYPVVVRQHGLPSWADGACLITFHMA